MSSEDLRELVERLRLVARNNEAKNALSFRGSCPAEKTVTWRAADVLEALLAITEYRLSVHPREDGSWIIGDGHSNLAAGATLDEALQAWRELQGEGGLA